MPDTCLEICHELLPSYPSHSLSTVHLTSINPHSSSPTPHSTVSPHLPLPLSPLPPPHPTPLPDLIPPVHLPPSCPNIHSKRESWNVHGFPNPLPPSQSPVPNSQPMHALPNPLPTPHSHSPLHIPNPTRLRHSHLCSSFIVCGNFT